MKNEILDLVEKFNVLIQPAIEGPNCIDPDICDGNCCYIHLDVPKKLIEFYEDQGYAKKENFQRGNVFSFQNKVSYKTLRCVFYDKGLNGCLLHITKMKIPQCWIYPTGLDPEEVNTTCKKASGWSISLPENVTEAKNILGEYIKLCKAEAQEENSKINIEARLENMRFENIEKVKPSFISGVEDGWDKFSILTEDSRSYSFKRFCSEHLDCGKSYIRCDNICQQAFDTFQKFLLAKLYPYIEKNNFKKDYTLVELQ